MTTGRPSPSPRPVRTTERGNGRNHRDAPPPVEADRTHEFDFDEPDAEELDEVLQTFRHYDRDGSGSIDAREFARLLEALGQAPTEEMLREALDVVDVNRSGRISWREFRAWWATR